MGRCCGGGSKVAYQVSFDDGKKQTYPSLSEAQAAARKGGSRAIKAVKAK